MCIYHMLKSGVTAADTNSGSVLNIDLTRCSFKYKAILYDNIKPHFTGRKKKIMHALYKN